MRSFDLIVTLYADARPAPWGVEEIRYGFPDAALHADDLERLRSTATFVAQRWQSGACVLVRCQAGINRSGLVLALVLRELGWQSADALAHLRTFRSAWALSNSSFRAALGVS